MKLRVSVVVLILGMFALLLFWLQRSTSGDVAVAPAPAAVQTAVGALPKGTMPPQGAPVSGRSDGNAVAASQLSRQAMFRDLVGKGTASAAFDAFGVINACLGARTVLKLARSKKAYELDPYMSAQLSSGDLDRAERDACGDLSPQDIASRIGLLETAAAAGIPSAAVFLTAEGPWGDESALYLRPKDPLVLEWRSRMAGLIHLSAAKGDLLALQSLSSQYRNGAGVIGEVNAAKALVYHTAFTLVYEAKNHKPPVGKEWESKNLASRLTTEQAAAAIKEGTRLAAATLGQVQQ